MSTTPRTVLGETRVVALRPFAKMRPRVTRRGTYMPPGYQARKDTLWYLLRAQGPIERISGPVQLGAVFRFKQKGPRLDLDNAYGALMDALNDNLYDDDSQVIRAPELRIERHTGRDEIEVTWAALPQGEK
jgi:Holliday junction resolvase RusA-like endonuclease